MSNWQSYLFREELLITWASKQAFEKEIIKHCDMKDMNEN